MQGLMSVFWGARGCLWAHHAPNQGWSSGSRRGAQDVMASKSRQAHAVLSL